jgi:hypothetical protein
MEPVGINKMYYSVEPREYKILIANNSILATVTVIMMMKSVPMMNVPVPLINVIKKREKSKVEISFFLIVEVRFCITLFSSCNGNKVIPISFFLPHL